MRHYFRKRWEACRLWRMFIFARLFNRYSDLGYRVDYAAGFAHSEIQDRGL